MAGLYVDTSALARVLLDEPDAVAIVETIERYDESWASALLVVELGRFALKTGLEVATRAVFEDVRLLPLDDAALARASSIPPSEVRSLDAIHLDAAVVLGTRGAIAAVLTFDRQLQAGCAHHGLAVEAPTA